MSVRHGGDDEEPHDGDRGRCPGHANAPVTRCEDRIRIAKDTSLANLPLKSIAASVALASMARCTAYPDAYPNRVMFAPIRRCPPACPPPADLHRRTRADLGGRVSGP